MHAYSADDNRLIRAFWLAVVAVAAARGIHSSLVTPAVQAYFAIYHVNVSLLEPPSAAALFALFFFVYDRILWKWPIPLVGAGIPNFEGAWRGTGDAEFIGKSRPWEFDIELAIRQRWTTILITSRTQTSAARSNMAHIGHDLRELRYEFINEPLGVQNTRHWIHRGVGFFTMLSQGALSGGYYNFNGPSVTGDVNLARLPPQGLMARAQRSLRTVPGSILNLSKSIRGSVVDGAKRILGRKS